MEEIILSLPSLYIIALLGMLVHFFKKQIKGETLTEIRDYFKGHFKSTVTAFIVTTIAILGYYFTLSTGQMADIVTTFGLGYTFDSMFNKWDTGA